MKSKKRSVTMNRIDYVPCQESILGESEACNKFAVVVLKKKKEKPPSN